MYGRFPYQAEPTTPAPQPHYCLILDVFENEEASGEFWVLLAMGTSKKISELRAGQFTVVPDNGNSFLKSGLPSPTKFSFERSCLAKLPYNDQWFDVPPQRRGRQSTPKVGIVDRAAYSQKIAAAGQAVGIKKLLVELDSLNIGALPAD